MDVCCKLEYASSHSFLSLSSTWIRVVMCLRAVRSFAMGALRCHGSKRDARKQRKALPSSVISHVRSYATNVHAGAGLQAAPSTERRFQACENATLLQAATKRTRTSSDDIVGRSSAPYTVFP